MLLDYIPLLSKMHIFFGKTKGVGRHVKTFKYTFSHIFLLDLLLFYSLTCYSGSHINLFYCYPSSMYYTAFCFTGHPTTYHMSG